MHETLQVEVGTTEYFHSIFFSNISYVTEVYSTSMCRWLRWLNQSINYLNQFMNWDNDRRRICIVQCHDNKFNINIVMKYVSLPFFFVTLNLNFFSSFRSCRCCLVIVQLNSNVYLIINASDNLNISSIETVLQKLLEIMIQSLDIILIETDNNCLLLKITHVKKSLIPM